ncbi:MAG: phosphoribosylformylglycinamidine synthase subunit PurQ [Candidatus Cloacimonetes bacterium]|nr:phosphoribosylformylglycinamidine synthase subunit PurQ [Candidatus Cloacimonadota bacterium]
MKDVKALVVTGFGINCEVEMQAAFRIAGAKADIVHLNDIFVGAVKLADFDILSFPGGFSFGDDLGSGKVLANKMKYKKMPDGRLFYDELKSFINAGKFIIGICNGFQFLVKMGLLPNTAGSFEQEVTLTSNDSYQYEDRWVYCKVNPQSSSPFLTGIDVIALPVRHGEGKLIINDKITGKMIIELGLNCLSYCDEEGNITPQYPLNPNGSDLNCAGLTDSTGRVFGMMPHPEAFLAFYNHPDWTRKKLEDPNHIETGEGLKIFANIVNFVKKRELK